MKLKQDFLVLLKLLNFYVTQERNQYKLMTKNFKQIIILEVALIEFLRVPLTNLNRSGVWK